MLCVAENKLTHVLALIGAFFYDKAIVLKQVIDEELIEFNMGAMRILVDLSCKSLTEDESVDKAA